MSTKPSYVFIKNQGIGPNAMSPSSSWAHKDIYNALQLATGPILCIFDGREFKVAISAGDALVRFGFYNTFPMLAKHQEKDVRVIAKIAARYWLKHELSQEQLIKTQNHYDQKYGRRFESPQYVAARRLLSVEPWSVGTAPLLAGLKLDRDKLVENIKAGVRKLLV